jgi:mono/diheme cytochrome c family protein
MSQLRRISLSIFSIAAAFLVPLGQAHADDVLNGLKPFFKQHCFKCHGHDKPKNDIRFDTLGTDLTDKRTLEVWQEALADYEEPLFDPAVREELDDYIRRRKDEIGDSEP